MYLEFVNMSAVANSGHNARVCRLWPSGGRDESAQTGRGPSDERDDIARIASKSSDLLGQGFTSSPAESPTPFDPSLVAEPLSRRRRSSESAPSPKRARTHTVSVLGEPLSDLEILQLRLREAQAAREAEAAREARVFRAIRRPKISLGQMTIMVQQELNSKISSVGNDIEFFATETTARLQSSVGSDATLLADLLGELKAKFTALTTYIASIQSNDDIFLGEVTHIVPAETPKNDPKAGSVVPGLKESNSHIQEAVADLCNLIDLSIDVSMGAKKNDVNAEPPVLNEMQELTGHTEDVGDVSDIHESHGTGLPGGQKPLIFRNLFVHSFQENGSPSDRSSSSSSSQ